MSDKEWPILVEKAYPNCSKMPSREIYVRWGVAAICRGAETDSFLLDLIRELGGYISINALSNLGLSQNYRRLLMRDEIGFSVLLSLKRNGVSERNWTVFKSAYKDKTFYCTSRTGLIRLLFDAVRYPKTLKERKVLTRWLKRHLTEAERIAVLIKLGIRKFDYTTRKRNIHADGIIKPIGRMKK